LAKLFLPSLHQLENLKVPADPARLRDAFLKMDRVGGVFSFAPKLMDDLRAGARSWGPGSFSLVHFHAIRLAFPGWALFLPKPTGIDQVADSSS
jgi:hypothetical protein